MATSSGSTTRDDEARTDERGAPTSDEDRADGHGPTGGAVAGATGPSTGAPSTDAGMATAEYAIATLAACGFAGLLLAVLGSDEVRSMLVGIVRRALAVG